MILRYFVETKMTAITKFLSREDSAVARGVAAVRRQMRVALRQHLEICQVYADALARNAQSNKR